MQFDQKRFMELTAKGCASAARTFGFRTRESRAGMRYTNPFPEVFATAETIRLLKEDNFRVMPEVVVREVLKRGNGGPANPGSRGTGGRFDVTAWSSKGKPLAALELKWKSNSIAADISACVLLNAGPESGPSSRCSPPKAHAWRPAEFSRTA